MTRPRWVPVTKFRSSEPRDTVKRDSQQPASASANHSISGIVSVAALKTIPFGHRQDVNE